MNNTMEICFLIAITILIKFIKISRNRYISILSFISDPPPLSSYKIFHQFFKLLHRKSFSTTDVFRYFSIFPYSLFVSKNKQNSNVLSLKMTYINDLILEPPCNKPYGVCAPEDFHLKKYL